jgi:hypothetical protein
MAPGRSNVVMGYHSLNHQYLKNLKCDVLTEGTNSGWKNFVVQGLKGWRYEYRLRFEMWLRGGGSKRPVKKSFKMFLK